MRARRFCVLACCLFVAGITLSMSFGWQEVETDYGKFAVLSPHFTQVNATNVAVIPCAYCDDPQIALCCETTDSEECVVTDFSCSTSTVSYSCD